MPGEEIGAEPGDAVIGVRGADGALVWVRGAPPSIEAGAVVRYARGGIEASGSVAIVPSLIAWCDPSVGLGTFLAATAPEAAAGVSPADVEPATLLAPRGAPDAGTLASRLDLARAELGRLDDPGIALVRKGPRRSGA